MVLSKPPICIDLFSHYSYFSNQNVKCYQMQGDILRRKMSISSFFALQFRHPVLCRLAHLWTIKVKWDQKSPVSNKSYDTDFCALPCDCSGSFFRGYADTDVTFCSKISGSQQKVKKYILPFQTWLHLNQSGGSTIIEFWGFGFWYSSCKWSDNFQTTHDFQCM